ncbi:MAG: hypothetical protein MJ059_07530 [Lachnospiraceae bacterium]|nr:hypothetical protein [Lachnospiraceae bacterium]
MKEQINIDFHPMEMDAMAAFTDGRPQDGEKIQAEFVEYVKEEIKKRLRRFNTPTPQS